MAEEGENVGTALRGFSGRVSRQGGPGRHCGAQERVGEEKGWRWPRGSLSVAAAPFGPGEREGTEERWGRGSEREGSRGRGGAEEKARGVVVASGEADEQGGGGLTLVYNVAERNGCYKTGKPELWYQPSYPGYLNRKYACWPLSMFLRLYSGYH